jgi:hypothetical protein
MGKIGTLETSASNHFALRNNPEDGRICLNRSGSLRSGQSVNVREVIAFVV